MPTNYASACAIAAASAPQGSVRRAVLEACAEHGVEVVLEAPRVADAGRWEGALLTSTSRLALPVDALLLPGGAEKSFPPESKLTSDIQQWVAARVEASSRRVVHDDD